MPLSPEELRPLVEEFLEGLELWPALHGQADSVRYSITVGGKRVRPVICLATAEAVGANAERALRRLSGSRRRTTHRTSHVSFRRPRSE